jgi:hypothetical protein
MGDAADPDDSDQPGGDYGSPNDGLGEGGDDFSFFSFYDSGWACVNNSPGWTAVGRVDGISTVTSSSTGCCSDHIGTAVGNGFESFSVDVSGGQSGGGDGIVGRTGSAWGWSPPSPESEALQSAISPFDFLSISKSGVTLAGIGVVSTKNLIRRAAIKRVPDVLVLGRGTAKELQEVASQFGGRSINTLGLAKKDLFRHIHREMRKADQIIQVLDKIPYKKTLKQLIGKKGQWSRAEKLFLDMNPEKFSKFGISKIRRIWRSELK